MSFPRYPILGYCLFSRIGEEYNPGCFHGNSTSVDDRYGGYGSNVSEAGGEGSNVSEAEDGGS